MQSIRSHLRSFSALLPVAVLAVPLLLGACGRTFNIPQEAPPSTVSPQWMAQEEWLETQRDGDFLLFVQRFDKADAVFRDAVKKAESFGGQDARLARSLTGLGRALSGRRDWDGARQQYERALSIKKRAYGNNSYDIADILAELALVNANQGRMDEARKQIDETKAIWKKMKIENVPEVSFVEAVVLVGEQRQKDAEALFDRATNDFLGQIDLHKYPQSTRSIRFARECIDRYTALLDQTGKKQLATQYRDRQKPLNEWIMVVGESG